MFTPLNFSKKTSGVDLTGEVQLVNYLNGLKKDIGLLINFGPSGVEIKRKYPTPNREI